jgi:PAS domain S-box-containing protein
MTAETRSTILLVEDNAFLAMTGKTTLTNAGYNALTARTGSRAVELVEAGTPIDLILMDVDLGEGMDGTEAAERIMGRRDIPVLFLSSHTEKDIVEKTERITSYGYVVKDSSEVVLIASIKMAFKLHAEKLRVQARQREIEQINRDLESSIVKRKRAEERAAELSDFRERVFNSIDARLAVVMLDGTISEVNDAWRRFAVENGGGEESRWGKGASYFRKCKPEAGDTTSADEAYAGLRRVQRGEQDFFTMEYPCHPPGRKRWYVMRVMPLKGRPGTVLVSHTDITAAWEVRKALEDSGHLLSLSQAIAHVGSWELDLAAGKIRWSDETFRIFGLEPQDIAPTYDEFLDLVHPDDRANVDSAYKASLQPGLEGYEIEHRLVHARTAEVRHVREKCVHTRDAAGKVVWSSGILEDITEQVCAAESLERAATALRESEMLFRNVFEHHSAVKLLIDPATGRILDANEAATSFYGWTKDELLTMRVHDINTLAAEEVKVKLSEAAAAQRNTFEFRHRRADGSVRDVAAYVTVIHTGQRSVIHSIITDITDRKQAEREREEALEAVQQQLAEKNLLLRETHHRIKNNIASIGHLLSMQADTTANPEVQGALQDAASRVNGMRVLYDRMLMADRYQEVALSTYLGGLVDSVVALFAGVTHVQLKKKFEDITLGSRELFPLGLIVNEIVTNMIKHAFAGRASGTVCINAVREGKAVALVLKDDGKGLPQGFSIEDSKGFGLTLVQMLCAQLEGKLTVDSSGTGTRWSIVFEPE